MGSDQNPDRSRQTAWRGEGFVLPAALSLSLQPEIKREYLVDLTWNAAFDRESRSGLCFASARLDRGAFLNAAHSMRPGEQCEDGKSRATVGRPGV